MERVHSRESVQQREMKSSSREKSPSAIQRRESWRERSKSPGSRRTSRASRLDSEDSVLDQSSTGDPTKPLSPSLRRRRFHERKVPIARRSSSMSIGDPTDTYRAVRPFKSVDYAYSDHNQEKKTIMVTDLDHAEVEMSKASRSTPNLSDMSEWMGRTTTTTPSGAGQLIMPETDSVAAVVVSPKLLENRNNSASTAVDPSLTIEESTAKIAAAVEDIDCVFGNSVSPEQQQQQPPPPSLHLCEVHAAEYEQSSAMNDGLVGPIEGPALSVGVVEVAQAEREAGASSPAAGKAAPPPLKSASASQVVRE